MNNIIIRPAFRDAGMILRPVYEEIFPLLSVSHFFSILCC